jgi:hypothetical protein
MPILTGRLTDQKAIIDVSLRLSDPRMEAYNRQHRSIPQPIQTKALLDTGAEGTMIDPKFVGLLELQQNGWTRIISITGEVLYASIWDAGLHIKMNDGEANVRIVAVPCRSLSGLSALGYEVVIGMDVLSQGKFTSNGLQSEFRLEFPDSGGALVPLIL